MGADAHQQPGKRSAPEAPAAPLHPTSAAGAASPVHSGKRAPRAGSGGVAARSAAQQQSDADYLSALQQQQQQPQHHQQHQHARPPASAFAAAATGHGDGLPLPSPVLRASATGMRSPHLGAAGTSAAAGGLLPLPLPHDGDGAALGPPGANPYLANLPSRRAALSGAGRRGSAGLDCPQRLTPLAEAAPEPRRVPPHVAAAARDVTTGPLVNSRLGAIVLSHLRQQHRAACLASPSPISTLPPVSLLRPYALPVARRELEAPRNVAARGARREAFGARGGRGGALLDRRLVYSRFRPGHALRDDGALLTAAAFARGYEALVVGTGAGELRVHDAYSGDAVDEAPDAHGGAVVMLQTHEPRGCAPEELLLLSSSRHEARLWRGADLGAGPALELPGLTRARFNPAGTQIVGVSSAPPRRALLYDAATGAHLATLDDASAAAAAAAAAVVAGGVGGGIGGAAGVRGSGGGAGGGGDAAQRPAAGAERARGGAAACFSPTGALLLWGATLWDPRVPAAVHTFDQLSEHQAAGSAFHPNGLELVLNSEVWDLRTFRLMRSVPCLDATAITFNSGEGRELRRGRWVRGWDGRGCKGGWNGSHVSTRPTSSLLLLPQLTNTSTRPPSTTHARNFAAGDVIFARLRRPSDDSLAALLHPRRRRHPLAAAFRTVDARTYAEIATVDVERAVLDLALDPTDSYLAVVAVDISADAAAVGSSVRTFEVGRPRPAPDDDESDGGDDGDDEDEEEVCAFLVCLRTAGPFVSSTHTRALFGAVPPLPLSTNLASQHLHPPSLPPSLPPFLAG